MHARVSCARSAWLHTPMRSLLLNASYEPLTVITWQKAIVLLVKGKVEVIASYDRRIRGVRISLVLPSVLRLLEVEEKRRPCLKKSFFSIGPRLKVIVPVLRSLPHH